MAAYCPYTHHPPRTTPTLVSVKAFMWFVVGGIVGFIVGVAIFRLAADPTEGWSDLASLFGSLFTYGPVGAVSGLALSRRKRSWPWAKMAIAGLILAAIPVVFLDASTVTTWGLAAYGLFVGAAAAGWLGHRDAGHQSFG
jgi:peptidoglycan/LPS O-acetylase OafA/YrhL